MKHEFTILYERGDSDWWIATVAEYPNAFSQGKTLDEARENVLDALRELMLAQRDSIEAEMVDKPDVIRETQILELT